MLKTEEIEIEGQKFKIRELSTEDGLNLAKYGTDKKHEMAIELVNKSVIEPAELKLSEIPFRVGNKLIVAINELNGLTGDFTAVPDITQEETSGK